VKGGRWRPIERRCISEPGEGLVDGVQRAWAVDPVSDGKCKSGICAVTNGSWTAPPLAKNIHAPDHVPMEGRRGAVLVAALGRWGISSMLGLGFW